MVRVAMLEALQRGTQFCEPGHDSQGLSAGALRLCSSRHSAPPPPAPSFLMSQGLSGMGLNLSTRLKPQGLCLDQAVPSPESTVPVPRP